MNQQDAFEISESPFSLPESVEDADPAERISNDIQLIRRLRDMLRTQRLEAHAEMRALLLKLLQLADALERILKKLPDPADTTDIERWNSIRVTRKLLDEVFSLQKVTPINLLNKPADPDLCEVDSYVIDPNLPDETVIDEIIRGYLWNEEAEPLRTAIVKVSRLKDLGDK